MKTPPAGLQQQYTLSKQLYDAAGNAQKALAQLRKLRQHLQEAKGQAQGAIAEAIAAFGKKAGELEGASGGGGRGGRGGAPAGPPTLSTASGSLTQLMQLLDEADVTPTTQLTAAVSTRLAETSKLMARWNALKGAELAALNAQLKAAGLGEIGAE